MLGDCVCVSAHRRGGARINDRFSLLEPLAAGSAIDFPKGSYVRTTNGRGPGSHECQRQAPPPGGQIPPVRRAQGGTLRNRAREGEGLAAARELGGGATLH